MLSIRGAISDLFPADAVDAMRAIKSNLETVTVENIGHAPMLDEPEAWDALLEFFGQGGVNFRSRRGGCHTEAVRI